MVNPALAVVASLPQHLSWGVLAELNKLEAVEGYLCMYR